MKKVIWILALLPFLAVGCASGKCPMKGSMGDQCATCCKGSCEQCCKGDCKTCVDCGAGKCC